MNETKHQGIKASFKFMVLRVVKRSSNSFLLLLALLALLPQHSVQCQDSFPYAERTTQNRNITLVPPPLASTRLSYSSLVARERFPDQEAAPLPLPKLGAGGRTLPKLVAGGRILLPASVTPRVAKVENAGLLFTDNPAGVSGVDAGYSLPMGRQTLWLFGDVFLLDPTAPLKSYVGAVSNCALLVPAGAGAAPLRSYTFLTDPKTGLARQVMPLTAEDSNQDNKGNGKNIRYWPFGGWYDSVGKRAYLYYGRIRTNGGGPFDFQIEGHGLAVAQTETPATLQFHRIDAMQETGFAQPLWWTGTPNAPLFGSAVITAKAEENGKKKIGEKKTDEKKIETKAGKNTDTGRNFSTAEYLYLVGVQERDGHKFGKLARVLKSKIADIRAYNYFAGNTGDKKDVPLWSQAVTEAADVDGLDDFPNELSVAYNAYLGGYLAVHSVGVTDKIRLSLASYPWGPYTPLGEISAPHRAFAHAFCYAGKEHPELAQEQGHIVYITYVDSERYWLQLLKVTLQR